jgi:hypothetical protein
VDYNTALAYLNNNLFAGEALSSLQMGSKTSIQAYAAMEYSL